MKRYNMKPGIDCCPDKPGVFVDAEESEYGSWVKFEDAEKDKIEAVSKAYESMKEDHVLPIRINDGIRPASVCQAIFKDDVCGYTGDRRYCNKSFEACISLGNEKHFGGYPGNRDRANKIKT